MKYLFFVLILCLTACDNGSIAPEKTSDGPPSSPPEPINTQAEVLKFEAAKLDSIKKASKDSTKHQVMMQDAPAVGDPLLGTWRWDHTVCCNRRPVTTRDSTADKTTIQITSDHITYFSGKKQVASKVYREGNKMGDQKTIRIEGTPYAAAISFQGDTLMIGYGYMDLQNEFYIRQK